MEDSFEGLCYAHVRREYAQRSVYLEKYMIVHSERTCYLCFTEKE